MYNQGEIVLVPFPFTNQSNVVMRPALVISGSEVNRTQDIILVQITKVQRSDRFSVALSNTDLTKPLNFISEIRCNKILVADQSLIVHPISVASPAIVTRVIDKINELFEP